MKLKEKWTKQNNSIKLLLRKLKRHDTLVVAVAVVIAVALCGGLIYISTPVVTEAARVGLEQTENENAEKTVEKLEELQEYLRGLDAMITENQESLSAYCEIAGNSSKESINEKTVETLTGTVGEKVSVLNNDMTTLKETINNTQNNVEKLREIVEKDGTDTEKKITEGFTNISSELETIKKKYAEAQTSTQDLINELTEAMNKNNGQLSEEMKKQYKDLLDKLGSANTQMTQQNNEMLESFKTDISNMSAEIDKKITGIDARVTQVNTDMTNNFNMLSTSMSGDFGELRDYLETEMNGVNDNLKQVFTSVSDGKKLLASALLTKGVTIREDATFDELYKAIISIPTEYRLDTGDATGKIEYEHHYHKDGQGNVCAEAKVGADRKGGCFTREVRHKHTDACYSTTVYYEFRTVKDVEQGAFVGDNWEGKPMYEYHCRYCGQHGPGTNGWHTETAATLEQVRARDGKYEQRKTQRTLTCKIKPGTLEGYGPACGMAHGQIVAAKIVFADQYEQYNTTVDPIKGETILTGARLAVPADEAVLTEDEIFDELISDTEWGVGPDPEDRDPAKEIPTPEESRPKPEADAEPPKDSDPEKESSNNTEDENTEEESEEEPEEGNLEEETSESDQTIGLERDEPATDAAEPLS